MQSVLILGTRTLALEIADLVSEMPGMNVAAFVENMDRAKCDELLDGLPVLWIDELSEYVDSHVAVCALATTHRSRFTQQAEGVGVRFATMVHPTAHISTRSTLGEGTIAGVGVVVATRTGIGRHVFMNRGVLIGHHTEIGDHVTLLPGANIAGNCRIGDATYVGMGAIVVDNITVGAHSVIGAGAVVTKDVPSNVQVVGVPARIVKENIPGK